MMKYNTIQRCSVCLRDRKYHAKGMCFGCYGKNRLKDPENKKRHMAFVLRWHAANREKRLKQMREYYRRRRGLASLGKA